MTEGFCACVPRCPGPRGLGCRWPWIASKTRLPWSSRLPTPSHGPDGQGLRCRLERGVAWREQQTLERGCECFNPSEFSTLAAKDDLESSGPWRSPTLHPWTSLDFAREHRRDWVVPAFSEYFLLHFQGSNQILAGIRLPRVSERGSIVETSVSRPDHLIPVDISLMSPPSKIVYP